MGCYWENLLCKTYSINLRIDFWPSKPGRFQFNFPIAPLHLGKHLKGMCMTNKFVNEAPYHPGYEDAGFKGDVSPITLELERFRKSNARYLDFANTIVDFCKTDRNRVIR